MRGRLLLTLPLPGLQLRRLTSYCGSSRRLPSSSYVNHRPRNGQPCLFPRQCLAISRWSGSLVEEERSGKCSPVPFDSLVNGPLVGVSRWGCLSVFSIYILPTERRAGGRHTRTTTQPPAWRTGPSGKSCGQLGPVSTWDSSCLPQAWSRL